MQNQMILPSPMRWGGIKNLIFKVPYTGIEILAIIEDDKMRGVIYLPNKLAKPIPWLSTCPHCRKGKQKGCPIKVKRAVQTLCSIKPEHPIEKQPQLSSQDKKCKDAYIFTLPNHYQLYVRRNTKEWMMRVRNPKSTTTLWVRRLADKNESFEGPIRDFRSPMLLRTLKLFFSAREPNENEIQTCLQPLQNQDPSSLKPSQRTPCRLCSWIAPKLPQPQPPTT